MTAFAACLFALAALASAGSLFATTRRFGPAAAMLRTEFEACPGSMSLEWKSVERVTIPALAEIRLRDVRKRPARRVPAGLEWPQVALMKEFAA